MKSYTITTKLQEAPTGEGRPEYDIEICVEEVTVTKRSFRFPDLNIPPGVYFAKVEIDEELYCWDIKAGTDLSTPTRLTITETRTS